MQRFLYVLRAGADVAWNQRTHTKPYIVRYTSPRLKQAHNVFARRFLTSPNLGIQVALYDYAFDVPSRSCILPYILPKIYFSARFSDN